MTGVSHIYSSDVACDKGRPNSLCVGPGMHSICAQMTCRRGYRSTCVGTKCDAPVVDARESSEEMPTLI